MSRRRIFGNWPAGKQPTFVGPDGKSIPLIVRHNVPYVQALVPAVPAPFQAANLLLQGHPPPAAARVAPPLSTIPEPPLPVIRGDPPLPCAHVDELDVPAPEPSDIPPPCLLDDLHVVDNSELNSTDPLSLHH